ncbi:hypothetical protein RZE82_05860 [Mollicutes bacterium LVI A0039]|nr:hypothetical protein RZE82_05860 [Mollicutes bacterium LVI A0039]
MSIKTKAEKHVIKQLQDYAESELDKFVFNKEVYYDSMERVIQTLNTAYHAKSGQGIEQLIDNISELRKQKEAVGQVLKDVEQTIEFNVD